MDQFNYCVVCNPDKNWLELEFRSELDEPINGLVVSISKTQDSKEFTQTTSSGRVLFSNISAGEWIVTVDNETLLTNVEKYQSRAENLASPVQQRASAELGAAHKNPKQYATTTIGDFWERVPEDEFLIEHHAGTQTSSGELGYKLSHNKTYVFEVKALRSYIPMIVDTDDFDLVNSYTFSLLALLAYANGEFGDPRNDTIPQGSIEQITKRFIFAGIASGELPHCLPVR